MIELPKEIYISRKSPTPAGARYLYNWLNDNGEKYGLKNGKCLEFSAGITSWAVAFALYPSREVIIECERYANIVNFKSLAGEDYFKNVEFYHTWNQIPNDIYDLVLVDGSTGAPPELSKKTTINRKEAIEYSEQFHRAGTIVIAHDYWNPSPAYVRSIDYLKNCGKYTLLDSFKQPRKGFGCFQRGAIND